MSLKCLILKEKLVLTRDVTRITFDKSTVIGGQEMSEFDPRGWNTDKALAGHYKISRVTVWRWVKAGRLQKPVKIGLNTTRWYGNGRQAAE